MKTYKLAYTPEARDDLHKINTYISDTLFAPQAAENLLEKIRLLIENLQNFPLLGKKIDVAHTLRWLKLENYMIFYDVDENAETVYIMRVLFGASDYLNLL